MSDHVSNGRNGNPPARARRPGPRGRTGGRPAPAGPGRRPGTRPRRTPPSGPRRGGRGPPPPCPPPASATGTGEPVGISMSSPFPASNRPGLECTSTSTPAPARSRRMYQSHPADVTTTSHPARGRVSTAAGSSGSSSIRSDDRQDFVLARPDRREVPPQRLEVGDRPGPVLGPVVGRVGRQQRLDRQLVEVVAGHRPVEVADQDAVVGVMRSSAHLLGRPLGRPTPARGRARAGEPRAARHQHHQPGDASRPGA